MAKIKGDKSYSIITDHLGTPLAMFDEAGAKTWSADTDIYGELINVAGNRSDCPFRFPGQYEDEETGLYYNRFRYYDAEMGEYVSQDPIQLAGENYNLYSYIHDTLIWVDIFGLTGTYMFTDGTTSYIGKGPSSRMKTSMAQRVGGESNVTRGLHMDFGDNDMGFMVEHKMMEEYNARYSPDFANSDRVSSPGKKLYKNADAATRAKVDANFNKMNAEYKSKAKGVSCK